MKGGEDYARAANPCRRCFKLRLRSGTGQSQLSCGVHDDAAKILALGQDTAAVHYGFAGRTVGLRPAVDKPGLVAD